MNGFLQTVIQYRLDAGAFGLLVACATVILHWRLHRRGAPGVPARAYVLMAALIGTGALTAEVSGELERHRLREMIEGFAPTYAQELQHLGHAAITLHTPDDDPVYRKLIDAEIRWQYVNLQVADIYTFRKGADGRIVFIIDSETDYNRDGRFDGEREARTAIGEPYDQTTPAMLQTFDGEASFDDQPIADRWGVWVSAYAPLRDAHGRVEAVVGVDYDARQWLRAIERNRMAALGFVAIAAVILIASLALIQITHAELAKRHAAEMQARDSESRLRAILDSEPEIVQLADRQGRIVSLNPAGVAAMEAAGDTELIGTRMDDRVIDAHRAAYAELHAAGCDGRAGRLQFQIVSRRGTTRWLDAHTVGLRDASGQYTAVLSVMRDITQQKQIEAEHERLQRQLLNTSRQAGMAEIASGILHNVGNVLNSVNVSASLASERLRKCKLDALQRVVELLRAHQQDIGAFMSGDARGRQIAPYLEQLAQKLAGEQVAILDELALLNRSVDHIRQIVSAQQSYAKCASIAEPYEMSQIVDDAVRMNALSLERHRIDVIRRYAPCPAITGDRHKVLQIFVNLIANAKKAITAARDRTSPDRAAPNPAPPDGSARTITLVIQNTTRAGQPVVRVQVIDSGVGIRAEDLSRIFAHGFTTRSDGHGFGLHTSALAAQQMGGTLSAASEGPGRGATFTLEIPLTPAEVRA